MGRDPGLRTASVVNEATASGDCDTALRLAEPLDRLRAEADLVEQLLCHIAEQHDVARAESERLERCCASMAEPDRVSRAVAPPRPIPSGAR